MKKKLIIIAIGIFVLVNILLVIITLRPTTLTPLLKSTNKDQIYYLGGKYYTLGNYYVYADQSRFVFVGKLQDVYTKDNNVYATVQLNNKNDIATLDILLQNGRVRIVDHPFDPLLGVYTQSNSQLLDNPQQVMYNANKYKNQNLVFFVALPAGVIVPPTKDPTLLALMQKPENVKLIAAQKSGADCGANFLKNFLTKKFAPLTCAPYISEIHVNTGTWKKQ